MKFLDSTGLDILWKKIKSSFLLLDGWGATIILKGGKITLRNNNESPIMANLGTDGITFFDNDYNALSIGPDVNFKENTIKYNNEPLIQSLSDEELNEVLV